MPPLTGDAGANELAEGPDAPPQAQRPPVPDVIAVARKSLAQRRGIIGASWVRQDRTVATGRPGGAVAPIGVQRSASRATFVLRRTTTTAVGMMAMHET